LLVETCTQTVVAWAKVAPGMVVCKAQVSDPGWGWEEAHVHRTGADGHSAFVCTYMATGSSSCRASFCCTRSSLRVSLEETRERESA
jgi:hypothetical protein